MIDTLDTEDPTTYWQAQVAAWQDSGLSQVQFCKDHNLPYHRFAYWRRKLERRARGRGRPSRRRGGFAVVNYQPEADTGLTLSLPNGLVVRGISAENLPLVRQLLDSL